ncbi:MAG: chorismate mutase [Candidatus Levybacteria bacterium]|nr:chorismate mutase [Candidatus Levybacteria bacterium]
MDKKYILEQMRHEIDVADKKLLEALAERMEVVKKVGLYKKERDILPLDPKRWQEVLEDKLAKGNDLDLSQDLVREIYEKIHKHALILEERSNK